MLCFKCPKCGYWNIEHFHDGIDFDKLEIGPRRNQRRRLIVNCYHCNKVQVMINITCTAREVKQDDFS